MSSPEIQTIILRFRDLVTQAGETIKNHAKICQAHGRVWWGWWSKGGERVPLEAFRSLLAKATHGSLPLFLFDSGRSQLYEASCADIKYGLAGEAIRSPHTELTPEYYREREYLAWFRFDEVGADPIPPEKLKDFSYVDVPEMFLEGENQFTQFQKKIVFSLGELRSQDRSLWFLRPARPDDATHELRVLDSAATQPAHFQEQFKATSRRHLLWLSDIHFGHQEFPADKTPTSAPLWMRLEEACRELKLQVAGVIISGDVAWRAQPAEFAEAQSFLGKLTSLLGLVNYDLLVCAGNHDFGFEDALANTPVTVTLPRATAAYSDFYRELFYLNPNENFVSGRRMLLAGAYPVEMVALNSVSLQQTAGSFQGFGFVGEDQLKTVVDQYGWDEAPSKRPLRIVVLHHHLVPVTRLEEPGHNQRYSLTLDAEAVMRWALRYHVDLVLHGHMHQPSCVKLTRPVDFVRSKGAAAAMDWPSLFVCGLGSTGVKSDHFADHKANTFGVLSFEEDDLAVSIYDIRPQERTTKDDLVCSARIPLP